MIELFLAVASVMLISAMCSGIEAALFSVSLIRAQQLADSHKTSGAIHLLKIRENMDSPIAALVFANNAANILGTMVIAGIAGKLFESFWLGVFSAGLTFGIIVFSEILPKTIGEMYSEAVALRVSAGVRWFTWLMTPAIVVINKVTYPITRHRVHVPSGEAEIQFLANMSQTHGTINPDESKMIHQVFKMNDLTAKQIMTPRVNMSYFYANDRLEDIKADIIASEHSRIIVVDETPDEVLGVVYKVDLLKALTEDVHPEYVKDLMVPIESFNETTKADGLLKYFQNTKLHIAIVRDEFDGVSGVVTLEDVLEIIVGEIVDETDSAPDLREV